MTAPTVSTLEDWIPRDEEQLERRNELTRAWLSLLNTKEGRLVLDDLWRTCRPEQSPLRFRNDGSVDERLTMVSLGHKEVWLQILYRLGMTYHDYLERTFQAMKEEQHERNRTGGGE